MVCSLRESTHDALCVDEPVGWDTVTSGDSEQRYTKTSRAFVLLMSLLVLGTVINIAFELALSLDSSGIRSHADNALSTLVNSEDGGAVRDRYGFEAYLHDVARGGTMTVPNRRAVYSMILENLSQVSVVVAEYDTEITYDRASALEPAVRIEGEGAVGSDRQPVRYWILARADLPAPAVTYYVVGGDIYIIDDRLGTP